MANDYEKAHKEYRELVKAAASGNAAAKADKVKAMNTIRQIEREAARAGTVLSAQYKGESIVINKAEATTKASLQDEYIRKFDGEKQVNVGGKQQTMRQYHKQRLGR